MKHTKNILKSLLITVMALSLLAVSCSKDEGGTKNPVNPAKPITITGDSITAALKKIPEITIGKTKISFASITSEASTRTITGTAIQTEGISQKSDLENKIKDGLKVDGATVKAEAPNVPNIDINTKTEITVTITITPNSGNSFDEANLKPYTSTDGKK